jgi:hypothetical protein
VKGHRGILNDQPASGQPALYKMLQKIKMFNPAWIVEEDDQRSLPRKLVIENDQGERLEFFFTSEDNFRR